jgi:hypothetical protein
MAEIALALVLTTGAGLLTLSYARLLEVESGFESDGVLARDRGSARDRPESRSRRRFPRSGG